MNSVFLENIHHAYAQTDGTYAFPNSREGDMLKRAKLEIESLREAASDALKRARNGRYTAAELMDVAKSFDALESLLANDKGMARGASEPPLK